ncbi:MAG: hypothetical protein JXR65_02520 [Bacteroidales bacterium]|nr:hypothetical protein [Bacteroidales bacterium]
MNKKTKNGLNILWKILLVIVITGALLARRYYRQQKRDLEFNKQMEFARKAAEQNKKYQDSLYKINQQRKNDSVFNARKREMNNKMQQLKNNIKRLEKTTTSK